MLGLFLQEPPFGVTSGEMAIRNAPRPVKEVSKPEVFGECLQKGLRYHAVHFGYCPHPVTVYIRGPIKGCI